MGDSKETPPPIGGGAKKGGKPPFRAPTLEEVLDHARVKGYDSRDAERFWNYQESKGWKVGSGPMKDWRAALRNWALKTEQDKQDRQYGRYNTDHRHGAADYGRTAAGRAERDAEAIGILADAAMRSDRAHEEARLAAETDAEGGGA